jgi:hypothetical protein
MESITFGDPVVRGPLAVYPLFGDARARPDYVPGPAAFKTGLVTVSEVDGGATVSELSVVVSADQPVLLIEGETILGAKQNRTLNITVLCASGVTTVPVSCLEAGRWGTETVTARSPRLSPTSVRNRKTESVSRSARLQARFASDQSDIWNAVDGYATRYMAISPTRSLEHVHDRAARSVAALTDDLNHVDGARGLVAAIDGRPASLDLFDRPSTLDAYWESLLAGAALDAIDVPGATPPSDEDIEAFVTAALRATTTDRQSPGLGTSVVLDDPDVVGSGLRIDGAFVHLAAFPAG